MRCSITTQEYVTTANLTLLQAMQTLLATFTPAQLEDDSVRQDIGIPLQKWIDRLEERLPKAHDR